MTFAVAILRIEYYNTARRAIMSIMTMSIICPPEGPLDTSTRTSILRVLVATYSTLGKLMLASYTDDWIRDTSSLTCLVIDMAAENMSSTDSGSSSDEDATYMSAIASVAVSGSTISSNAADSAKVSPSFIGTRQALCKTITLIRNAAY